MSTAGQTLVRGGEVLCGVDSAGDAEIVTGGAVLVEGGAIAAIDRFERLRMLYPECRVIGSDRAVVSPGLVNAHHHVGLTPFQLGAPDLPLELWLAVKIGFRQIDPYLDALYSAFEMIELGVTTVQHLHVSRGSATHVETQAEAILRAYRTIGMRVSYSYGYRDQNLLAYEDDDVFLSRLPQDLAAEAKPWFVSQHIPLTEHLAFVEHMVSRHALSADGRIAVQLAPSNLHWCSDDALHAIGEVSRRHQLPMHMHLLETSYQAVYARLRTGKSAIAHLDELGLLGPLLTLGHAVWVDREDIERIAKSGACLCHNASSNMRLRSGRAPCRHFLERGIPVAIGMDEAGINDDRDMLQEMRLILHLHKEPGIAASPRPRAADVFRMATVHGADTTPFRGAIGRLAVGMAADLVLFDADAISGPYIDAEVPLVDAIVQRAKQNSVRLVMIGGRVVFEDGRFSFVDREAVVQEIRQRLAMPPSCQEHQGRLMAKALLPHLQRLYTGGEWGREPIDRSVGVP